MIRRLKILAGLTAAAVLLALTVMESVPAHAQAPMCQCKFARTPWEAFGTKAFCTAKMRPGLTSCQISFAGFGADMKLMADVGLNPSEYRRDVLEVVRAFEKYLIDEKAPELTTPAFLSKALLVLMRGAYLRLPLNGEEIQATKLLDAAVKSFGEKYADQVSSVFLGKSPAFSTEVNDTKFEVGRGYVIVESAAGTLITRYIPAE